YFWSHNPSGQDQFSQEMCHYLGLPFRLSVSVKYHQQSWCTQVYKVLHDYHIARGFDPQTVEFAESFGFPIFEIV
ncbi:hypothetical protein L218DRAFT_827001, partial [Marasmius fiardii PR-910]